MESINQPLFLGLSWRTKMVGICGDSREKNRKTSTKEMKTTRSYFLKLGKKKHQNHQNETTSISFMAHKNHEKKDYSNQQITKNHTKTVTQKKEELLPKNPKKRLPPDQVQLPGEIPDSPEARRAFLGSPHPFFFENGF